MPRPVDAARPVALNLDLLSWRWFEPLQWYCAKGPLDVRTCYSSNSCRILLFKVPIDSPCCPLSNEYGVVYGISKRQRDITSVYLQVFNGVLLPNCFSWVHSSFQVELRYSIVCKNLSCGVLAHPAFVLAQLALESAVRLAVQTGVRVRVLNSLFGEKATINLSQPI